MLQLCCFLYGRIKKKWISEMFCLLCQMKCRFTNCTSSLFFVWNVKNTFHKPLNSGLWCFKDGSSSVHRLEKSGRAVEWDLGLCPSGDVLRCAAPLWRWQITSGLAQFSARLVETDDGVLHLANKRRRSCKRRRRRGCLQERRLVIGAAEGPRGRIALCVMTRQRPIYNSWFNES